MDLHKHSETNPVARPSIDWAQGESTPRVLTCPVCGARGDKHFVLAGRTSWGSAKFLELLACSDCESKFFADFEAPKYEHFDNSELYLKFYLEIGAGIDQLIRHLFSVPLRKDAQYLEIGCGFGFALDFARRSFGVSVLGVDPSPFAAAGIRVLDLPIIPDYLTPDTDLGGRRFDLAVASEVIEHVFSPVDFLRLISNRLTPDGVLILTTPNAASIAKTTSQGMLIPLLSVGWHYILYSSQGLARVLRAAGFKRVEVVVRDHTLVAAATNGAALIDLSAPIDRNLFRKYLDDQRHFVQNDWLCQGLGYRLFKDLTNAGEHPQALAVYEGLRAQIRTTYRFDLESPQDHWLYCADQETFATFGRRYPMYLCGIAYFRGVIALNHENVPARALQSFSLAIRYGDMLRAILHQSGADDAETEIIIQQSEILTFRALAYSSPAQASARVLEFLARDRPSPLGRQQKQAALEIFAHLVHLGALADGEPLEAIIATYLRDGIRDVDSDRLRIELHRAIGVLELNHRRRPRLAALHFALAERVARQYRTHDPEWAWGQIWPIRVERMLAWATASHPQRALLVARLFTLASFKRPAPAKVATQATHLGCDLHRSLGLIKLNQQHRPREAALHFALAERAARRFFSSEPEWAWEHICHARHDRLLSWIVAGNGSRALRAGKFFRNKPGARQIPVEVAESASRLIAQVRASLASK